MKYRLKCNFCEGHTFFVYPNKEPEAICVNCGHVFYPLKEVDGDGTS